MERKDIAEVVNTVVERVLKRLEDTSHGELPTPADERMYGERLVRLHQAVEQGASRLTPQAFALDQCGDLAPLIEQIFLRPDARASEILDLCRDAIERRCVAVCVDLEWTETASAALRGSGVHLSIPVGFPTGTISTEAKTAEVRRAVGLGADEVDVVLNLDALRAADYNMVTRDLRAMVRAAQGRTVKAVVEAAGLTREQKTAAAILAKGGGACDVKSSTGFGPDAVTVGDVALLRAALMGLSPPDAATRPEWPARVGAVVCLSIRQKP